LVTVSLEELGVGTREKMDQLLEERRRLRDEIATLKVKIDHLETYVSGLERAIVLVGGEAELEKQDVGERPTRRRRSSVKSAVLELLSEQKEVGLSAAEVLEVGASKGIDLDRGSVSSLLSKLKGEGVLTIEGSKYKLAQPTEHVEGFTLRPLGIIGAVKTAAG
jgi:hypothetical protein